MMAKAWNQTRASEVLGIEYPIIQGPLGGLSSQRLTAAVSNFGGLGSFGAHGLEPNAIKDVIDEIRSLTAKPFAMNLWVSMEDEGAFDSTEEAFDRSLAPLTNHIESVGGSRPTYRPYEPVRFEDQMQVLLDEGSLAFSFIYGIPSKQILDEFRRKGIVLIGTATTVDESIALEQAGVDVVAASGFEAGGHRGSFEPERADTALIGLFALLPAVVDAVGDVPVVATGGIADARGIAAVLLLGASAVQIGTGLLRTPEAKLAPAWADTIGKTQPEDTVPTRAFSGRLGRSIATAYVKAANAEGAPKPAPYPVQRALSQAMRDQAAKAGDIERMQAWAGQAARLATTEPAGDLVRRLWAEAQAMLKAS